MPWRSKQDEENDSRARQFWGGLSDELKNKKPEEIAQALKDAEELRTRLTTTEATAKDLQTKLQTQTSEFEQTKTRLAALEAAARGGNGNSNNEDPNKPITAEDFINDPSGVLTRELNKRIDPVQSVAVANATQTARILAQQHLDNQDFSNGNKTMDGRLFRAWSAEIDAFAEKNKPGTMMTPGSWVSLFLYVKGLHADELANPEERKKKYGALEPARSNVSTTPEADKPASDQLTDQEKHIADKLGVSHENYLKRKKAMNMAAA